MTKGNGEVEEQPVEALMVLKYGGVLTHAGRKQVLINRHIRYKWFYSVEAEFYHTSIIVENKKEFFI